MPQVPVKIELQIDILIRTTYIF